MGLGQRWLRAPILYGVLVFVTVAPTIMKADGPDPSLLTSLEYCIQANAVFPENCQNQPYIACMGEQLNIAANPSLASERCWHQEGFVWGAVGELVLDRLKESLPENEWRALEMSEEVRLERQTEAASFPALYLSNGGGLNREARVKETAREVRNRTLRLISYEDYLRHGAYVFQSEERP